jgi:hypothetical protein
MEVTACGGNDFLKKLYTQRSLYTNTTENEYLIHDNGGRPFKVCINWPTKTVFLKGYLSWDDMKLGYVDLGEFKDVERIFIGPDNNFANSAGLRAEFLGNSILLEVSERSYVHITGMGVRSFTTEERIHEYFSPVGNNDVPYPYATSDNFIYFLSDGVYYTEKSTQPKKPVIDFVTEFDYEGSAVKEGHGVKLLFKRRE